jgi:anaphase-promoting complex subunit 2
VKCVVATLVEGDELQDENEAGGLITTQNDETVEEFLDPKWEPEPIDAAPRGYQPVVLNRRKTIADDLEFRSGKASDIVSTLVSIYDTREVIIKELQVLLATRLLAVKDYDAVREVGSVHGS